MGDPLLFWGIFVRGLCLVYVVAFYWIAREVIALGGSRGVTPVRDVLARARADLGARAYLHFPTLFWLSSSDRALRGTALVGAVAACLALLGGPLTTPLLVVAWLAYLSYDVVLDLKYPWECALFEAGSLVLLLPPLAGLPSLGLSAAPPIAVSVAFTWLLFRIVFGFGKFKFFGPGKLHGMYLKGFLIDQPIPARSALLLQRAPSWFLRVGLGAVFVVEVIAPFVLLVGPWELRAVAALAIAALMLAIWATGNYGFFNALVLLLCLPVLAGPSGSMVGAIGGFTLDATTVVASAHVALSAVQLPFNSWVTQSWMYWPWFVRDAPLPVRAIARLFRALRPFRLMHAYGVFSPESGPPVRWVPVIEGTEDGETWAPYEYRYVPSVETSQPTTVAPGMPRLDHFTIYEGYGLRMCGLYASVFSTGNPYLQSRAPFIERLVQRLLEGNREVEALFARAPFESPPRAIRVRLYAFEPADGEAGVPWSKRFVHEHLPARRRNDACFDDWVPRAEELHFDEIVWRTRMRSLPAKENRRVDELVRGLSLRLDAAALREDSAAVQASSVRWRDVARLVSGRTFDDALRSLGELGRTPSDATDPRERGLAIYAAFHADEIRLTCRTARLMEVTLRGAAREPPPIAPGFLRWLPRLAELYREPEVENHPRYWRDESGQFTRTERPCN